jgi:hypothetical protein
MYYQHLICTSLFKVVYKLNPVDYNRMIDLIHFLFLRRFPLGKDNNYWVILFNFLSNQY